jgi:hypothetical protein
MLKLLKRGFKVENCAIVLTRYNSPRAKTFAVTNAINFVPYGLSVFAAANEVRAHRVWQHAVFNGECSGA